MTLIFRFDNTEDVLRSVGDQPNGVVGVHMWPQDDGSWRCGFSVDARLEPADVRRGLVAFTEEWTAANHTEVTVEEAIGACVDDRSVQYIIAQVRSLFLTGIQQMIWTFDTSLVRGLADFADAVVEAVADRRAEQ